jgi:ribosomal protein L11 methylase PrmA
MTSKAVMAKPNIPREEISFVSDSFIDPNGRVFEWRDEVYRALTKHYAPFCTDLFEKGIIQQLIKDNLLVESEIVDWSIQPGDLVLRHRKIPVLSYCFEWPAAMLKRAALLTIDLCIRLAEHDLTLQDGHPWNILFDGTKPVFLDLSSIVPARDDILWAPYQQFCNFFLFPLYLYSARQERIARWLLHDTLEGVTNNDLANALPVAFKLRHPLRTVRTSMPRVLAKLTEKLSAEMQNRLWNLSSNLNKQLVNQRTRIRFYESLRKEVESIKLPLDSSHWADYYSTADRTRFKTGFAPDDWAPKEQSFLQIIRNLKPATVLDLGCNTGRYARLAAESGARVIACDTDSASISRCYEDAKKASVNVLSLVVNPFNSPPAYGRGGAACPSASERLQSNLVLALAVVHHVVANQRLDMERIVHTCNSFSRRWVLIEFVPPQKPKIGASSIPFLDDYSLDTLHATLQKQFKSVVSHDSFPNDRKLLLCEK